MPIIEKWLRRGLIFAILLAAPFVWQGYGPSSRAYTISSNPAPDLFLITPEDPGSLIGQIDSAENSIDLWMYTLTEPNLALALERASMRGVTVRLLLEDQPFGGFSAPIKSMEKLSQAGAQIHWDGRPLIYQHAKTMIIDNSRAIVGTANWTKAAFSSNRELFVALDDAAMSEKLSDLFEHDFGGSVRELNLSPPFVASPGQSRFVLEALISQAREEIFIALEVFNDPKMIELLKDMKQRGVKVRVLLADPKKVETNKETAQVLQDSKIEVRFQKTPFLHAKYFIIDGSTAFIGSQNFTAQSLDANREIGIVARAPKAVKAVQAQFIKDWQSSIQT